MPSYTSLKKHTFDKSTDVMTAMYVDARIAAAGEVAMAAANTKPMEEEGSQIHIDGQRASHMVEGAPFTLESTHAQLAEGSKSLTTECNGITVMNVIDQSKLPEIQTQMAAATAPGKEGPEIQTVVVTDESGVAVSDTQQVQYYIV